MSKSPAFQFYPADFLADKNVQCMTDAQIGIYIKLLCHAWLEGSIPSDLDQLSRFATKEPDSFKDNWRWISSCFEVCKKDPSKLINPRLEKERRKQKSFSRKQSNAAKSRWQKEKSGDATALPRECFSSSSSTTVNTPLPPTGEGVGFEKFWGLYPQKVGEAECRGLWERRDLEPQADIIIQALEAYKVTDRWTKEQGRYIPRPAKFIRDEYWKAQPDAPEKAPGKPKELWQALLEAKQVRSIFPPHEVHSTEQWEHRRGNGLDASLFDRSSGELRRAGDYRPLEVS